MSLLLSLSPSPIFIHASLSETYTCVLMKEMVSLWEVCDPTYLLHLEIKRVVCEGLGGWPPSPPSLAKVLGCVVCVEGTTVSRALLTESAGSHRAEQPSRPRDPQCDGDPTLQEWGEPLRLEEGAPWWVGLNMGCQVGRVSSGGEPPKMWRLCREQTGHAGSRWLRAVVRPLPAGGHGPGLPRPGLGCPPL